MGKRKMICPEATAECYEVCSCSDVHDYDKEECIGQKCNLDGRSHVVSCVRSSKTTRAAARLRGVLPEHLGG
jgi:hypothetical protein